ncbi:MAG: hypothetical protein ACYCW6_21235 [Candidatus Xenobia bacterium]
MLANRTGYLPVRLSAMPAFLAQHPAFTSIVATLPLARIQPRLAAWESVRGILDDAVASALSGNLTPGLALTQAAAQTSDLIQKLRGR